MMVLFMYTMNFVSVFYMMYFSLKLFCWEMVTK